MESLKGETQDIQSQYNLLEMAIKELLKKLPKTNNKHNSLSTHTRVVIEMKKSCARKN